jgi:hypothetical protein
MTPPDDQADPPSDHLVQLPAIIRPAALTSPIDAYAATLVLVLVLVLALALIADAGDAAGWRYVEFFTANIRNPNTRRAYAWACARSSCGATTAASR